MHLTMKYIASQHGMGQKRAIQQIEIGHMDGWIDRWMDEWINRWADR